MRSINLIHVPQEFSLLDYLTGEHCEPPVPQVLRAAWIFMLGSMLTTLYLVFRASL